MQSQRDSSGINEEETLAKNNQTALRRACRNNQLETVKSLLEEGVDFDLSNLYDSYSSTAALVQYKQGEWGSIIDNAIYYANTEMLDYLMPIYNEIMEMRKVYSNSLCAFYKRDDKFNRNSCMRFMQQAAVAVNFYGLYVNSDSNSNSKWQFCYYQHDKNKIESITLDSNQFKKIQSLLQDQHRKLLSLKTLYDIAQITKHHHLPAFNLQVANKHVPTNTFQTMKTKFDDQLAQTQFIHLTGRDGYENSPLINALICQKKEHAKLLIEKKYCDANSLHYLFYKKFIVGSALTLAIELGYVDIATMLVERGADLSVRHGNVSYQDEEPESDPPEYTALMLAAKLNQVELVKVLLAQGANILDRTSLYQTAVELTDNPVIKSMIEQYTLASRLSVISEKVPEEFTCPLHRSLFPNKPPKLITDPITDPNTGIIIDRQALIDVNKSKMLPDHDEEDCIFPGGHTGTRKEYYALVDLPQTKTMRQIVEKHVIEREDLYRQKQQVQTTRATLFPYKS